MEVVKKAQGNEGGEDEEEEEVPDAALDDRVSVGAVAWRGCPGSEVLQDLPQYANDREMGGVAGAGEL